MSEPENLVAYCGLYCDACGIRQGKIKVAAENLRKSIYAYGFEKMMPELAKWEPSLQHYKEFEQVLTGLVNLFGSCPGCKDGGANPGCEIRICAQNKKYKTCAQCQQLLECQRISQALQGNPAQRDALIEMKQIGPKTWGEKMRKKVEDGFSYLNV